MVRSPVNLAVIFVVAAALYAFFFWLMVSVDPKAAQSRFDILVAAGADGRAIRHGEHVIALRTKQGVAAESLMPLKYTLAQAHVDHGNAIRAVELHYDVLGSQFFFELPVGAQIELRNTLATLELLRGNVTDAARIFTHFLDAAGDDGARRQPLTADSFTGLYLTKVQEAMERFTEALPPVHEAEHLSGTSAERLEGASHFTTLGGYYASLEGGAYAAASLLSAAYTTRVTILGAAHKDTLHTILLLGPAYQQIKRLKDAERLYMSALHAQERLIGSNNPDLSLYLRLLAEIYKEQNRLTEAEALNVHIRRLFKDAFGARRYEPNQNRDRRLDINRPVSQDYTLTKTYRPSDLVPAAQFDIPLSKSEKSEEMSIRLADTALAAAAHESMPQQLQQLLILCQKESGEQLTLRSGYRSYTTQSWLFNNKNHGGQVATPGTSEHQLGLAVDIDVNRRLMRSTDRAYQCFETHAWRFGFLLSYPKGNAYLPGAKTFEPWHWRYVTRQTALLYRETGPLSRPQEFLAALPCYEERAQAGLWSRVGDDDVCLLKPIRKM